MLKDIQQILIERLGGLEIYSMRIKKAIKDEHVNER
jgi:hypothetical protein